MPGFIAPDISKCAVQATKHLLDRMSERQLTAAEVDDAVYNGVRFWENPAKFKGVTRSCTAVVHVQPCHLTVATAWRT
jgi:hypothetical protein